jgi:hypothetical protein
LEENAMDFRVGQRVVCVNTSRWPRWLWRFGFKLTLPKQGGVYTVRAIYAGRADGRNEDGVWLVEIVNPTLLLKAPNGRLSTTELAFRMSRFRPLRTTNIDVFTAMLEPAPKQPADLIEA